MPATPIHNTAVVDEPWDGPGQVAKLNTPLTTATGNAEFAWRDPNADETTKAAWKLPHHQVDSNGKPGAANMAACRAAMSRLGQSNTDIPQADRDACRRHIQHHMDAFMNNQDSSNATSMPDLANMVVASMLNLEPLSITAAISEERLPVARIVARELAVADPAVIEAAARSNGNASRQADGGVGIVPLHGVITPRGSMLARLFGLGSGGLEGFRQSLAEAVADDNVSSIVIDIDSPGGLVDQVPETAAAIAQARGNGKPIVAVANTMAASAAYWLASQADEIVATPSGQVGSIGVYSVHEDVSRAADAMGIKTTIISAGRYKTEGNPFEPLSKSAQQAMQTNVDDLYEMFVQAVADGRNTSPQAVRAGYGQGRVLFADRAQMLGMVDRVESFDQTIARLGGSPVDIGEPDDAATVEAAAAAIEDSRPQSRRPETTVTRSRSSARSPLEGKGWRERSTRSIL